MFAKLLLLFICVPLVEITIFIELSDVVSKPLALLIIIATGALGAYLAKQQGGLAIKNFRSALRGGQLPHKEAVDGILILLASAVLLTPGFLTDAVGFALLVPAVRGLVRGRLSEFLKNRISVQGVFPQSQNTEPDLKKAQGRVIDVD